MRRIFITEKQLRHFLSENIEGYTEEGDMDSPYDGFDKVRTGSKIEGEDTVNVTSDMVQNQLAPNNSPLNPFNAPMANSNVPLYRFAKITEGGNRELKNHTYAIPPELLSRIKANVAAYQGDKNDKGYKAAEKMAKNGNIGYNRANYWKSILGKNSSMPMQYSILGGQDFLKWIEGAVGNDVNVSKNVRDAKVRNGIRVIAPHTKDHNNGKGHVKKDNEVKYF